MSATPTPSPFEAELHQLLNSYDRYVEGMAKVDHARKAGGGTVKLEAGTYISREILERELLASHNTAVVAAQIDLAQELLDAQDQEVDLDGRPIFGPYYIFSSDGVRYYLEQVIEKLDDALQANKPKEGE